MQYVDEVPVGLERRIKKSDERVARLQGYFQQEIEDAFAARSGMEADWREDIRRYEGTPRNPAKHTPMEDAPNLEIPLGAIACDMVYAYGLDALFSPSPIVTCRPTYSEAYQKHAEDFQDWTNWATVHEYNTREAAEHVLLDDVQLGTGIFYCPWVTQIKKTDIARVTYQAPEMRPQPIEDFIVPGGTWGQLPRIPWVGLRFYYSEGDFANLAARNKWDADKAKPGAYVGWVRSMREQMARNVSNRKACILYEVLHLYANYDWDGDGLDEDMLVIWDRSAQQPLWIGFTPYDSRPVSWCRYQLRAHQPNGIGVMRMMGPFQDEVTMEHNERLTNARLANMRVFKGPPGAVPEGRMRLFPGRYIGFPDADKIGELKLSDTYPSAIINEESTLSLARQRVGMQDLSGQSRPSAAIGGRTPGITAMTVLQQVNRRFIPAFDQQRFCVGNAIWQCSMRYSEQIKAGNADVARHIRRVMGPEKGRRVVELLADPYFDRAVTVEMTASSASVNQQADRQDALLLVNILGGYYEKALSLIQIASQPAIPQQVREVAQQIAKASGALIERTIRKFDTVRDPKTFVVEMQQTIDSLPVDPTGLAQLLPLLQTMGNGNTGLPPPA